MSIFSEFSVAVQSGYGWLLATGFLAYELFAPTLIDRDTALAPLVRDLPEKVDTIGEKQNEIQDNLGDARMEVTEVKDRQKIQMQVQRAQARANDQMDEGAVDQYLLKNGVEPTAFLRGDEMSGFENWGNDTESEDEN